jgi:2-methylisocitrate lyase-like PEP mutase family enzyme
MSREPIADLAERLRALHRTERPLVLANAWDAASARTIEAAGLPAVATSSSAVAASLGYEDGEAAPAGEMLASAARIARSVAVPVTVDCEAGYGLEPRELVERLLGTGAAGCNLEDTDHGTGSLVGVEAQADRLAAVRAAAEEACVALVVNARVDVFLHGRPRPETELVEAAVERGRRYLQAGADCVYPIMAAGDETIARLVAGVGGPVNVLYRPGAPGLRRLAELGVARVSFGGGLWHLVHDALRASVEGIAGGRVPY